MSTTTLSSTPAGGKALRFALWAGQVILAGMFGFAAFSKLTPPADALAQQLTGPLAPSVGLARFIGLAEVAGAAGVLLPALTRVLPWLTPLAALGLFAIMVLATGFHLIRGEYPVLPVTIGLGLVALFVAWGRFKAAPIPPRG